MRVVPALTYYSKFQFEDYEYYTDGEKVYFLIDLPSISIVETAAYKTSIEKAKTIGLIDGVAPTRFSPGGLLIREQAAKILCDVVYRIEGIEPKPGGLPNYTDSASISGWATMYVAHAQENSIMLGSSGKFTPKAT